MAQRKRKSGNVRLYKTIFEVRYEAKLTFYDLLLPAAQKMDEYPHWITDKLSITLKDFNKRCSLAIRHQNLAYNQDSDDIENEEKNIKKAMELLPKNLNISSFTRLGFRRHYLIPTPMRFNELNDILNVKLLLQNDELRKILPQRVDDFAYRLDCSDDTFKYHIYIGPIRKSEIPRWINFNKELHLDPKTQQKDYLEILEGYPDVAIFIDIDIYREKEEILVKDVIPLYKETRDSVDNMVSGLKNYLL